MDTGPHIVFASLLDTSVKQTLRAQSGVTERKTTSDYMKRLEGAYSPSVRNVPGRSQRLISAGAHHRQSACNNLTSPAPSPLLDQWFPSSLALDSIKDLTWETLGAKVRT
ncbi:hypothetical protein FRC12_001999 [Ceratobasidium sp. 428]|nr:hypothetical protein FRC12_001999 [Ceratobasidium sp. 428]